MKTGEEWAADPKSCGLRMSSETWDKIRHDPHYALVSMQVSFNEPGIVCVCGRDDILLRKGAEEMRETLVNLVGDQLQASARLVEDMLALPLPGYIPSPVGFGDEDG